MANKFNFGAPRIPGYKKKVGTWDEPRRSDTPIIEDDIFDIAVMYYINADSLTYIGKRYGVGPVEIRRIVKGQNFHKEWSSACVNLTIDGHELERAHGMLADDKSSTEGALRPSPLGKAEVLEIRTWHMDGVETDEILARTGLKVYRVRAVLRSETFNNPECKPPGWRAGQNNWRRNCGG
jgi:hypothetical protein